MKGKRAKALFFLSSLSSLSTSKKTLTDASALPDAHQLLVIGIVEERRELMVLRGAEQQLRHRRRRRGEHRRRHREREMSSSSSRSLSDVSRARRAEGLIESSTDEVERRRDRERPREALRERERRAVKSDFDRQLLIFFEKREKTRKPRKLSPASLFFILHAHGEPAPRSPSLLPLLPPSA